MPISRRRRQSAHPAYALGNLMGQTLAGEAIGGAVGAGARAVPKIARGAGNMFADATKPATAAKLVADTAADNTAAIAKANTTNAVNAEKATAANAAAADKAAAINARRIAAHAEKTQSIQAANDAQQAQYAADQAAHEAAVAKADEINKAAAEDQTEHGQAARQVQQQSARLVDRVKAVQAKWKDSTELQRAKGYQPQGILDRGYAQVRQATGGSSVPREMLASAVEKAEERLKGSDENIKVFRDILKKAPDDPEPAYIDSPSEGRIPQGHPLYDVLRGMSAEEEGAPVEPANFSDLQGYYSELGAKLKGGNLPADVYRSMRSLQDDIGAMMQKMANENGVGAKFRTLQTQYRDYMQTFRESTGPNHSGSPIAQSLDAADPTYAIKPLTDPATAGRVRNMLSRFDPAQEGVGGAGQLYDNFRSVLNKFENSGKLKPAKEAGAAPTPPTPTPLPDRPAMIQPKKIQPKVVQPDITQRGLEDIQAANKAAIGKAATGFQKAGLVSHVASGFMAYDLAKNIISRETGKMLLLDIGARGLVGGVAHGDREVVGKFRCAGIPLPPDSAADKDAGTTPRLPTHRSGAEPSAPNRSSEGAGVANCSGYRGSLGGITVACGPSPGSDGASSIIQKKGPRLRGQPALQQRYLWNVLSIRGVGVS
jgi:hypothetical protein